MVVLIIEIGGVFGGGELPAAVLDDGADAGGGGGGVGVLMVGGGGGGGCAWNSFFDRFFDESRLFFGARRIEDLNEPLRKEREKKLIKKLILLPHTPAQHHHV